MNKNAKIITISSIKGAPTESSTSANLATLLAHQGHKVCLLDAGDSANYNDSLTHLSLPNYTLEHVISGKKSLIDIIISKDDIHVIPGASSCITKLMNLDINQRKQLSKLLQDLKNNYDYLVIENPDGMSEKILTYFKFSNHNIIVITPEPASIRDAFALIRVLYKNGNKKKINILVKHVTHKVYAYRVFNRLLYVVDKFVGFKLKYLGYVVSDEFIANSVSLKNPVILQGSNSAPKSQIASANIAKTELINQINDKNIEQEALKNMVQQVNNAYLKRFGDYAVSLPQVLSDAIKMDRISKLTMKNLIMTLQSLYQDQYLESLEDAKPVALSSPIEGSPIKQETAELLINLLQKETSKNNKHSGPKLVPPLSQDAHQELIDSIRYAAMIDN